MNEIINNAKKRLEEQTNKRKPIEEEKKTGFVWKVREWLDLI